MSLRTRPTERTVRAAYAELRTLFPNTQPLTQDPFFKTWSIGRVQIGETAREATAYLRGLHMGLRASAFLPESNAS